MGSLLVGDSRDAGLQDEDSYAGKTDEEEDWGRIKYDGGGGGSYVGEILGSRFAESFQPIAWVLSQLRRRNDQWQSLTQEQLTSGVLNPTNAATDITSNNIGPTYLPEPTITLPAITSQLQPSDLSTVQITLATPTPALFPTSAPISTDSTAELTLDTKVTTTIVSTISNFAPNGTGGDLARVPITTGGTVIIFTTPTVRNKTTLMNTLSKFTTTRKMNNKTTSSTTLSTTANITAPTTVYVQYGPPPTAGENTPSSPTSSEGSDVTSNDSSNLSPPQVEPRLVGGIVGGVAGLALIVFALFLLLKRHKKQRQIQAWDDAGYGGPLAGGPSMAQRSISFLRGPQAGGGDGGPPSSDPTNVDPAERGFVKVAGRKLPPAIGGPRPELGSMKSNAQSSYYTGDDSGVGASMSRSSRGPSRYSTSTVQAANPFASPPSSPIGPSPRLQEPVDTDSIEELRAPPKPPPPRPLFNRQLSLGTDSVGRSHPSHDGSRGSRFTEDIS
ncbi:hypothetical protein EV426DRAFT_709027 [Tirmania nivea]|nr:hypothetical protein EV426DRAFT_709027 [Tirmania nivea]